MNWTIDSRYDKFVPVTAGIEDENVERFRWFIEAKFRDRMRLLPVKQEDQVFNFIIAERSDVKALFNEWQIFKQPKSNSICQ